MPVTNADAARWSNATMPANAYEQRVTPAVGAGREVMRHAGFNGGGYETKVTPSETGSH